MPKADVTYNTIGFIGDVGSGATFTLYLDNEKTGAKTYHVWFKQLGGTGKLTLTTGKSGAVDLVMGVGTYVAIISVDEAGNIVNVAETPTDLIQAGNNAPLTSNGATALQPVDTVTVGNMHSVTSNAVAVALAPNMETILNGNMLTSEEYQIASENYDCLYFDVEPVSGIYHYTLLIPCALLTTTYALYWLTGFYQNTVSNYYIAMGVKKDSVKVTYIQQNGSLLSQLNNVKLYGLNFNNTVD
jgi:hypothetical protein